ncbi:MAG: hypothetical protein Q9165_005663 [Trypethelium subeluteriae]
MADTKSSPPTDAAAPPTGFSYAQAAKRKSQSLQPTSHAATNAHEVAETLKEATSETPIKNWAEEAETSLEAAKKDMTHGTAALESTSSAKERPQPSQTPSESQATVVSNISTPEFGVSSTSTLAEKEDVSSIPNTSSESTWENKSQASNSAERSSGTQKDFRRASEDVAKESTSLKEAPPPQINVWQQRAKEQQAAKAAVQPAKGTSLTHAAAEPNNKARDSTPRDATRPEPRRKARSASADHETTNAIRGKDRKRSVEASGKSRDDGKTPHYRRASRIDNEAERSSARKTGPKSSLSEQEGSTTSVEPPSVRDETSWPAMGANTPEEKPRKPQEKDEKERTPATSAKSHGKQGWVQMPIPQTNYLFDTPLPNTGARRGGRGGGRGARENGGRGGPSVVNGSTRNERPAGSDNAAPNSEASSSASKRDKPEADISGNPDTVARKGSGKESVDFQSTDAPSLSASLSLKSSTQAGVEPGDKGAQTTKESQSVHSFQPRQAGAPKWRQSQRNEDIEIDRRRESGAEAKRESRRHSIATQHEGEQAFIFVGNWDDSVQLESIVRRADHRWMLTYLVEYRERRVAGTADSVPGSRYEKFERRDDYSRPSWKEAGHESFPSRSTGRGRGRGSRRGAFAHGFHQNNHNGPSGMHGQSYAYQTSPSFQQHYGNSSQSQRGYRGPRSQSMANGEFARTTGSYAGGPGQLPQLQTYADSTPYEYQMMQPMSAMAWQPPMEAFPPVSGVIQQLEYYLSLENMLKDTFLRSHMDSKGYLDLEVVANFPRLKGNDMELIKLGCYMSSEIDLRVDANGKNKIRKSSGWEQWVLDMEQRQPSAQNDGSEQLQTPPRPQPAPMYYDAYPIGPQSPISPGHVPSGHNGYAMSNSHQAMGRMSLPGYPFSAPPDFTHHNEGFPERFIPGDSATLVQGGESQQQDQATDNSGTDPVSQDPDPFPDERIPGLNVVYRMQNANSARAPFHSHESRTFSNGSIDGGNVISEARNGSERQPSLGNGGGSYDGENGVSHHTRTSSPTSSSPQRADSPQNIEVLWVKDSTAPVDRFPQDTQTEPYTILHVNALADRYSENIEPCSKNMLVLYQFWSHFLIRNFNTIMYDEFRRFAFEDDARGSTTGISHLIEFYGKSLSSQFIIRECVARDYAALAKEDGDSGRLTFQQLRKQWRDGALNIKNRKQISEYIDKELKAELEK